MVTDMMTFFNKANNGNNDMETSFNKTNTNGYSDMVTIFNKANNNGNSDMETSFNKANTNGHSDMVTSFNKTNTNGQGDMVTSFYKVWLLKQFTGPTVRHLVRINTNSNIPQANDSDNCSRKFPSRRALSS